MSEALIGVLIGGIIASIAPIATLYFESLKWKKDSQLEYLKLERERLRTLFEDILDELSKAMAENRYPSQMISEITVSMSKEISETFISFMEDEDKTDFTCRSFYMEMSVEMKKFLKEIDDKIANLVGLK